MSIFLNVKKCSQYLKDEIAYEDVYNYLDKYTKNKEINHTYKYNENAKVTKNKTIWMLWLQGLESAPVLVKKCIDSIRCNKPSDYELVLLTEENLDRYIRLPEFICEKYNKGIITPTHLSDIVRVELLHQYGGCWIDATVYCSSAIPHYMLENDFFMFRWSIVGKEGILKGSSWWLTSKSGGQILSDVRALLYKYWKAENKQRNYYLLHIILSKVIDDNSFNRNIFKSMPYVCNANPHILYSNMALEYNPEKWEIIKANSAVHKLSYKKRFIQGDIYSFYSAFLDGELI